MSDTLRVTAIELDPGNDRADALRRAVEAVSALPAGTDIALLPEMLTTGFLCQADSARQGVTLPDDGTLDTLRALSHEKGLAICGSLIMADTPDSPLYNRAFFIEPGGDEHYYDKYHLFTVSGEQEVYARGTKRPPLIRFRGWNIMPAVCFDLRFPVWLRNDAGSYDLLLIVANWPEARTYAWQQLLIARAIENQAYVAGCNRRGSLGKVTYSGDSMIIDPYGKPVGTPGEAAGTPTVGAALSKSALIDFREKFPVYLEPDPRQPL